jgi:hypothetical protein
MSLSFKYRERNIDVRLSNNPCAQEKIGTNIYGHRLMHSPWYWFCGYLISCFAKSLRAYWTKWAFGIQQYNFVRHQKFMIGNISITSRSYRTLNTVILIITVTYGSLLHTFHINSVCLGYTHSTPKIFLPLLYTQMQYCSYCRYKGCEVDFKNM